MNYVDGKLETPDKATTTGDENPVDGMVNEAGKVT
jgi:hypothetical protein